MEELELPAGWEEAPIGAFCMDIEQGVPGENETFFYIDIGSVDRNTKTIAVLTEILGVDAPSRARKRVRVGDVLVSMTRPNLNAVALVPPELDGHIATTGFDVLRCPALDCRWLFYLVRTKAFVEDMDNLVQGALYPAVKSKDIRSFVIPVAPINEQRRIASKLDTTLAAVDACRQRLDGVAAILKRFRQAVLAAATSGELTREWREERGMAMDLWEGCIFRDIVGESRTGLVRSSAEQYERENGLMPYLKMDSIGEAWGCNYHALKGVHCDDSERKMYELVYGDWLFNTRNSLELVGKSCVWEGPEGVVFNNNILRVRFTGKVRPQWIEIYFRSPDGKDMLAGVKSATTSVAAIYQRSLMALEIPVPSLEEQCELIDRVEYFLTLANQLEARLTAARKVVDRLTPALLAKAFRGELVPQDPGDEPASVLLERIRAARQVEAGAGKPARRGRPKAAASPATVAREAAPVPADCLAALLRECGALSERALLAASELEPARFRAQLTLERQRGAIRDTPEDSGQVLLEASA